MWLFQPRPRSRWSGVWRANRSARQSSTGARRPAQQYDAVVIDTSPAMNLLTYNALLFAEELIIPVGMDLMAVIGARQTFDGIVQVRDLWPDRRLDVLAVLPTSVHSGNHATRATMEALEHDPLVGRHVFQPGIRQCIDLSYATASHQTIWEYAPRSRAAEDYTRGCSTMLLAAAPGRVSKTTRPPHWEIIMPAKKDPKPRHLKEAPRPRHKARPKFDIPAETSAPQAPVGWVYRAEDAAPVLPQVMPLHAATPVAPAVTR